MLRLTKSVCFVNPVGEIQRFNGYGLKWLDLDADILAALNAANILMFTELHELTELQVCQIFQPKADDPHVLSHPNPTGYIDRITFDRFERLKAKLDEKNLRLEGPRLSRQELQMQL
jgi:hypothetical protein